MEVIKNTINKNKLRICMSVSKYLSHLRKDVFQGFIKSGVYDYNCNKTGSKLAATELAVAEIKKKVKKFRGLKLQGKPFMFNTGLEE